MKILNELFRFRMLMAGIYTGLAVSSTYGFSLLTEHLKRKYDFNQSDITTISTVGNCVGYLSFFAGMLFDFGGPKAVFPIAGFLGFLGFLLFGLAFDDVVPKSDSKQVNMIKFCIFNALLYLGCPAMDGSTVMPLMMNFPLERGYMVIIQKTFSGLGTSVLMAYFNGWFYDVDTKENSNYAGYSYFVGAQIFVCAIIGAIFIDLPPYAMTQFRAKRGSDAEKAEREETRKLYMTQHTSMRRIYIGCVLVAANLIFLTVSSIVTGFLKTSKGGYVAISVIAVILLAAFALMALPLQFLGAYTPVVRSSKFPAIGYTTKNEADEGAEADAELEKHDVDLQQSGDTPIEPCGDGELGKDNHSIASRCDEEADTPAPAAAPVPDPQYRGSFWRHLISPDLWLLWLGFFGMWGTGTVMQMNAAQIYQSKNYGKYESSRLSLYVAIMGVGSALGRILGGAIDMTLSRRKERGQRTVLTTTFLPVGAALLAIAYLVLALIPADGLILPFILGSIGTGLGWGLGVLSVRILYASDPGKHYNFMFSSGFVCTIALNRFMFGEMYDKQSDKDGKCSKPSCVRNQMFILMAVNIVSTLSALLAHLRFRSFVNRERKKMAAGVLEEELKAVDTGNVSENDLDRISQ